MHHVDIEYPADPRRQRSLMRSIRTGSAVFATGVVTGVVLAIVFSALIKAAIIIAALLIVGYALLRMTIGRRRQA